jgi:hypothetical protein
MTLPTVHLNGTSGDDLLLANREARRAVRVAYDALRETAPHGRDYYPQGDDAIQHAVDEYRSRLAALQGVMTELDAIARHLLEVK